MTISLLDKTFNRLLAQRLVFEWAFKDIAAKPGLIFELGLGKGRTFSHLRKHLPDRTIYVFDKAVDTAHGAVPDESQLILGDIEATLPAMARRFAGQVILANSDVGSPDKALNRHISEIVSAHLPQAIAPGGIIMSDLDLNLPGYENLALPPGAVANTYTIYRRAG